MSMGGRIEVERVSIAFDGAAALHDLSFVAEPGEFVCLLGPSGCGKSSLLGALAGHLAPSQGQLRLDGEAIAGPGPDRGLVFQHHTLFPWKTVLDNVGHGLKMQRVGRAERTRRALDLLQRMGLQGFEQRYPGELSGGMQQRVEIARVLISHPRVLLMDEPFGALDALTRARMQALLLALWTRTRPTVLFVTHDIDEALFLADRVLVLGLRPGRIVEEITVPFERPRPTALSTRPDFIALKRRCLALLQHEAVPPPHLACDAGPTTDQPPTTSHDHDLADAYLP